MKNFYIRLLSSFILGPFVIFAIYYGSIYFLLLNITVLLLGIYEIIKNVKQKILIFILLALIIIFIFSFYLARGTTYEDLIIFFWILSIVWLSDIGGYLIGKLFGGPKLSKLSPNKTIAGFYGSIFFSQFSFLILMLLNNFSFNLKYIFIQIILSMISVMGDIFFSYIKRINKIKDYSNLIPGHGGVLDRIDGMIFVFIFFYIINNFYGI